MSTTEPTATPLPSGVSPPPETITSDNQGGVIAIITGFALGIILLSACMKLYVRKYFRNFRHDDLTFALAICFAIIQSSLVFYQIHSGLGMTFSQLTWDQEVTIRKTALASDLLYILILYLSKTCCALFFLWLAPDARHKHMAWFWVGACTVWMISSLFVEGFRCPVGADGTVWASFCDAFFARWLYIGVFDMLLEVALFLTAWRLIWNRHIPLKARLGILSAFACRLLNIPPTSLRLSYLATTPTSSNSPLWTSNLTCVTQMALAWSVFSSVVPYLRPLLTAYEREGLRSGKGTEVSEVGGGSGGSGSRTGMGREGMGMGVEGQQRQMNRQGDRQVDRRDATTGWKSSAQRGENEEENESQNANENIENTARKEEQGQERTQRHQRIPSFHHPDALHTISAGAGSSSGSGAGSGAGARAGVKDGKGNGESERRSRDSWSRLKKGKRGRKEGVEEREREEKGVGERTSGIERTVKVEVGGGM